MSDSILGIPRWIFVRPSFWVIIVPGILLFGGLALRWCWVEFNEIDRTVTEGGAYGHEIGETKAQSFYIVRRKVRQKTALWLQRAYEKSGGWYGDSENTIRDFTEQDREQVQQWDWWVIDIDFMPYSDHLWLKFHEDRLVQIVRKRRLLSD